MPKLGLIPTSEIGHAEQNFRRIENVLQPLQDVDSNVSSVTGTLVVVTKLTRVVQVVGGFDILVAAGACFVVAYVGPAANEITLEVWDSTFNPSVIAADIAWIATGERNLS